MLKLGFIQDFSSEKQFEFIFHPRKDQKDSTVATYQNIVKNYSRSVQDRRRKSNVFSSVTKRKSFQSWSLIDNPAHHVNISYVADASMYSILRKGTAEKQ